MGVGSLGVYYFFSGASRRALQGPPAPAGYPLRSRAQAGFVVDEEVEIEPGAVAFAAIGKVRVVI